MSKSSGSLEGKGSLHQSHQDDPDDQSKAKIGKCKLLRSLDARNGQRKWISMDDKAV